MDRKYCFLVLSCDKNIGLLDFFFAQFFANLFVSIPVYVLMENLVYQDRRVRSICPGKMKSWSGRLVYAVDQMDAEQILILCDDHIVEKPMNVNELDRLSICLTCNPHIGNIMLTEIVGRSYPKVYFEHYVLRKKYGRYQTALQVGLWRREFLKKIAIRGEDPWSFEIFSNMRRFLLPYHCLALADNRHKPIVYNDGFFVVQGKVYDKERRRLERILGRPIAIEGLDAWEGEPPRDKVLFVSRVCRRLKIMVLFVLYFLRSLRSNKEAWEKD